MTHLTVCNWVGESNRPPSSQGRGSATASRPKRRAATAEELTSAGRKRRGSRGGRPPAFDAEIDKGRNVVERRFCHLKQWRGLATRYDKLAITYRAAAVLNAVIAWTRHLSDMP